MRTSLLDALVVLVLSAGLSVVLAARGRQEHQHPETHPESGAHHHPQAAKLKNPVPPNAASIAAGKVQYEKLCSGCHGDAGKGDGAMGEELTPKPSNLSDSEWKHGSTDGEIFTVIREGVKNTGMKPYARKITAHQVWDVVNYVRSLGPAH